MADKRVAERRTFLVASVVSWGTGWAIAVGAAVSAMYVHLEGGGRSLTTAIVVLGGAIGLALGAYFASRFGPSLRRQRLAERQALAWALAFVISSVFLLGWTEFEPPTLTRILAGAPLLGMLGGLFAGIGTPIDYLRNRTRRILVMVVAWTVAVSAGAMAAVPATYLLAQAGSSVLAPISDRAGAVLGSALGGLLGGSAAALIASSLERHLGRPGSAETG